MLPKFKERYNKSYYDVNYSILRVIQATEKQQLGKL